MIPVYLKNFRKGFATNSSSTHSVIYRNKDEMFEDLDIFETDYYDRCTSTIAASKNAKIKYVAANIMYNDKLFEIMCQYYPEMKKYKKKVERQKKHEYDNIFGMYCRGNLYFKGSENLEPSIDYLRNVIDNDEIVIVGGSDEMDFVYDTIEDHKELPEPDDVYLEKHEGRILGIVKNGNYWVGYGINGKMRFNMNNEECIPQYPELVDICITKKCQHACDFCFMSASMNGKDADIDHLKTIIRYLKPDIQYKTRIEFSVGGGNILLYPHLKELFKFMTEEGHIVNTTIQAKDCETIIKDEKLRDIFSDYVTAIGVSVSNDDDLKYLEEFKNLFKGNYNNTKQITIHLIPEMLGVEKTLEYVNKAHEMGYYSYLFLGYKNLGRGKSKDVKQFTKKELLSLFNSHRYFSIDTTFANTYKEWLGENYATEHTITYNEGEYSMYIDGVEEKAYKSSYQLDKPYDLKFGKWEDKNKTWFSPNQAFNKIREDSGFKVFNID